MVINNEDPKQTAFTVSVDVKVRQPGCPALCGAARPAAAPARRLAQEGTTTGISAADRAATFRALANPASVASDFNRPGHVFPLRPKEGGVLERDGHTEAAVDFCRLAGCAPAGVLSEICNDDGSMSRLPELRVFCEKHSLVLTSIADLQAYIKETGQAPTPEATPAPA